MNSMESRNEIAALTFDTGGTVLDWLQSVTDAMADAFDNQHEASVYREAVVNWRRHSLEMVKSNKPAPGNDRPVNFDEAHRITLDTVLDNAGLEGLDETQRDGLAYAWHDLVPWPDVSEGLTRLRKRFILAPLTLLSTSIVVDNSRNAGLSWDCVISCEMIGIYKPDPQAYLTAAKWLSLPPERIMMVACHNHDLRAAKAVGFKTAHVARPGEWGGFNEILEPDPDFDIIASDFGMLADKLDA